MEDGSTAISRLEEISRKDLILQQFPGDKGEALTYEGDGEARQKHDAVSPACRCPHFGDVQPDERGSTAYDAKDALTIPLRRSGRSGKKLGREDSGGDEGFKS